MKYELSEYIKLPISQLKELFDIVHGVGVYKTRNILILEERIKKSCSSQHDC